jgi:hypothetical protein
MDGLDMLGGWIPFVGHVYDLIQTAVAVYLFGPIGLINAWEVIDVTNGVDAFVPTMTITYVLAERGKK